MRRSRFAACLAAAALASACAAGPAPPHDRFWRLGAVATTPASRPTPLLDGALLVERVRADGLLGERALLASEADRPQELQPHPYHHWAEAPADMLQRRIARELEIRGIARRIVTPELRVEADYSLAARLLRFERVLGGDEDSVVVELTLSLRRERDGRVLQSATYREERATGGDRVRDAVPAFDAALTALLARFSADLAQQRDALSREPSAGR